MRRTHLQGIINDALEKIKFHEKEQERLKILVSQISAKIDNPFSHTLFDLIGKDPSELCCQYLETWCPTHQVFVYGTSCVFCIHCQHKDKDKGESTWTSRGHISLQEGVRYCGRSTAHNNVDQDWIAQWNEALGRVWNRSDHPYSCKIHPGRNIFTKSLPPGTVFTYTLHRNYCPTISYEFSPNTRGPWI
jgi:hypothetical protein